MKRFLKSCLLKTANKFIAILSAEQFKYYQKRHSYLTSSNKQNRLLISFFRLYKCIQSSDVLVSFFYILNNDRGTPGGEIKAK